MLLSTATRAPASWAAFVKSCRSQTCMRGLVGDSNMTSLVFPGLNAFLKDLQDRRSNETVSYLSQRLKARF